MKIKKLIKRLSEDGHMIKIRKGDVKITVYPIFQNDEGGQDPEKEEPAEPEPREPKTTEEGLERLKKELESLTEEMAAPEDGKQKSRAKKKKQPKTVKIDHGKIMALHDAGWSIARISDELCCSMIDVSNHIKGTF